MIFAIAMLVTQISIFSLSKQYEQLTERVGQVYLDGLSASVLPAYRQNDLEGVNLALRQSLDFYLGIVDRQLTLIDKDTGIIAHVSGPNLEATTPPPDDIFRAPKGYAYELESQSMWVWRELEKSGIIAANLDLSEYAQKRSVLHLQLLLASALMSVVAALGGYIVIRRMQRPLRTINEHLSNAVAFGPQKIEESSIPKDDEETSTLMHAYNRMTMAVQDRERLSEQLAKQDQLTGMMTALQTIRMYGENTRSRSEALDFIDRGIQSLQGVAEATLKTYRPSAPGPDLESQDLHDVLLLVEPHAARKRVHAVHHLSPFSSVRLDAFKIRQIALNLLLNAVESSPAGGIVSLEASYGDNVFTMKVSDEGEGLPQHVRNFLLAEDTPLSDRSLGLEIVRRLTQDMGGDITVYNQEGRDSTIELRFPIMENTQ